MIGPIYRGKKKREEKKTAPNLSPLDHMTALPVCCSCFPDNLQHSLLILEREYLQKGTKHQRITLLEQKSPSSMPGGTHIQNHELYFLNPKMTIFQDQPGF